MEGELPWSHLVWPPPRRAADLTRPTPKAADFGFAALLEWRKMRDPINWLADYWLVHFIHSWDLLKIYFFFLSIEVFHLTCGRLSSAFLLLHSKAPRLTPSFRQEKSWQLLEGSLFREFSQKKHNFGGGGETHPQDILVLPRNHLILLWAKTHYYTRGDVLGPEMIFRFAVLLQAS